MPFLQTRLGAIGSLAEVTTVFVIGSIIANLLFAASGVTGHPLAALANESNPDLWAITADLAKLLLLQYAGWLSLALVFSVLIKSQPLRRLGVGLGGKSVATLLAIGVLAWAIGDLANKVLWIVDAQLDIGQSVPWREALINSERSAGWWALMAVGSFALVPVVEELFWRGYVQSRLALSLGVGPSIVITATMFTLSHAQYHHLDMYHMATIGSVFLSALTLGWVFHKTNSLLPPMIMHAMLNFPVGPISMWLALGVMLALVVIYWRSIEVEMTDFLDQMTSSPWGPIAWCGLIFVGGLMLALSQKPTVVMLIGYVAAPVAIGLTIPIVMQRIKASRLNAMS